MNDIELPGHSPDPSRAASREPSRGSVPGTPGTVVDLATVARRILSGPARLGRTRLVCLDGPAGSGKSTLARRLIRALGDLIGAEPALLFPMTDGPVGLELVHMDDLYEGWHGLDRVWPRLEAEILAPLRAGRTGRFRRYDWARRAFAEWCDVPARTVLVLEGVGSADRPVDRDATLKLWVEAPLELRYARGIERDGEAFRPYWEMWADAENTHFATERTRERADLIVDGAPEVEHDPETQLVVRAS